MIDNERILKLEKENELLKKESDSAFRMLQMVIENFTDSEEWMPEHDCNSIYKRETGSCSFCDEFTELYYKYFNARWDRFHSI